MDGLEEEYAEALEGGEAEGAYPPGPAGCEAQIRGALDMLHADDQDLLFLVAEECDVNQNKLVILTYEKRGASSNKTATFAFPKNVEALAEALRSRATFLLNPPQWMEPLNLDESSMRFWQHLQAALASPAMALAETAAGVDPEDRAATKQLFAHRIFARVKGFEGKRAMGPDHLLSAAHQGALVDAASGVQREIKHFKREGDEALTITVVNIMAQANMTECPMPLPGAPPMSVKKFKQVQALAGPAPAAQRKRRAVGADEAGEVEAVSMPSDAAVKNAIIMSVVHEDSPMYGSIHAGQVGFVLVRVIEAVAAHLSPTRLVEGPGPLSQAIRSLGKACCHLVKRHGDELPAAAGRLPKSLDEFAKALKSYLEASKFMPGTTSLSREFQSMFGPDGLVVGRYVNVRSPNELLSLQAAQQQQHQQQHQQQQQQVQQQPFQEQPTHQHQQQPFQQQPFQQQQVQQQHQQQPTHQQHQAESPQLLTQPRTTQPAVPATPATQKQRVSVSNWLDMGLTALAASNPNEDSENSSPTDSNGRLRSMYSRLL
jgi:hypothetical protein